MRRIRCISYHRRSGRASGIMDRSAVRRSHSNGTKKRPGRKDRGNPDRGCLEGQQDCGREQQRGGRDGQRVLQQRSAVRALSPAVGGQQCDCPKERRPHEKITGAGNQKLESPSAAAKAQIRMRHRPAGFMKRQRIREAETLNRKRKTGRFPSTTRENKNDTNPRSPRKRFSGNADSADTPPLRGQASNRALMTSSRRLCA